MTKFKVVKAVSDGLKSGDLHSKIAGEYNLSEFAEAIKSYTTNMSEGKVLFKLN
jgi:hypothetical protein